MYISYLFIEHIYIYLSPARAAAGRRGSPRGGLRAAPRRAQKPPHACLPRPFPRPHPQTAHQAKVTKVRH